MIHSVRTAAGAVALAFLALHLPFLATSLEDLDSINFALGIRDFDVALHRPHPPGYPVFVLVAKALDALVGSEVVTLSLLGAVAGAAAVFGLAAMVAAMDGRPTVALATTLVAVASPLFWVTAARPLSDMPGLAAALAVQVLSLTARTERGVLAAAVAAGVAAGVRSQVVWLTVPLLVVVVTRRPASSRLRVAALALGGCAAGALGWLIPLVVASGGPSAYLQALATQGTEDFTGVAMLWTTPTPRLLLAALTHTFLDPWPFPATAASLFVLVSLGFVALIRGHRPGLVTLSSAFGPYLAFHLLFQETATTRYALPLVVPVAYLAVVGLWSIRGPAGGFLRADRLRVVTIIVLTTPLLVIGQDSLYLYSRTPPPAFQLMSQMRQEAAERKQSPDAPLMAMHRRSAFDFRRPIEWVGPDRLPLEGRLATPPKHEWLPLVRHWTEGGQRTVWFVADPLRSDLALVEHQPPRRFRWPSAHLRRLLGGSRPNEMDWYVIPPPAWYLGEGWALTPETAGVAREDRRGPGFTPIEGWLRRGPHRSTLMIGGRKLSGPGPATVRIAIDDRPIEEIVVAPGFFLRLIDLSAEALLGDEGSYARLTVAADSDQVAIEQFDLERHGDLIFGLGEGWHEQEYNPTTGRLWRWTSERAAIRVRSGGGPIRLEVRGESDPSADAPRLIVRIGDRVVVDEAVGRRFSSEVVIPGGLLTEGESVISVDTNETHVPAELRSRSQDRRRLGLIIDGLDLRPAS